MSAALGAEAAPGAAARARIALVGCDSATLGHDAAAADAVHGGAAARRVPKGGEQQAGRLEPRAAAAAISADVAARALGMEPELVEHALVYGADASRAQRQALCCQQIEERCGDLAAKKPRDAEDAVDDAVLGWAAARAEAPREAAEVFAKKEFREAAMERELVRREGKAAAAVRDVLEAVLDDVDERRTAAQKTEEQAKVRDAETVRRAAEHSVAENRRRAVAAASRDEIMRAAREPEGSDEDAREAERASARASAVEDLCVDGAASEAESAVSKHLFAAEAEHCDEAARAEAEREASAATADAAEADEQEALEAASATTKAREALVQLAHGLKAKAKKDALAYLKKAAKAARRRARTSRPRVWIAGGGALLGALTVGAIFVCVRGPDSLDPAAAFPAAPLEVLRRGVAAGDHVFGGSWESVVLGLLFCCCVWTAGAVRGRGRLLLRPAPGALSRLSSRTCGAWAVMFCLCFCLASARAADVDTVLAPAAARAVRGWPRGVGLLLGVMWFLFCMQPVGAMNPDAPMPQAPPPAQAQAAPAPARRPLARPAARPGTRAAAPRGLARPPARGPDILPSEEADRARAERVERTTQNRTNAAEAARSRRCDLAALAGKHVWVRADVVDGVRAGYVGCKLRGYDAGRQKYSIVYTRRDGLGMNVTVEPHDILGAVEETLNCRAFGFRKRDHVEAYFKDYLEELPAAFKQGDSYDLRLRSSCRTFVSLAVTEFLGREDARDEYVLFLDWCQALRKFEGTPLARAVLSDVTIQYSLECMNRDAGSSWTVFDMAPKEHRAGVVVLAEFCCRKRSVRRGNAAYLPFDKVHLREERKRKEAALAEEVERAKAASVRPPRITRAMAAPPPSAVLIPAPTPTSTPPNQPTSTQPGQSPFAAYNPHVLTLKLAGREPLAIVKEVIEDEHGRLYPKVSKTDRYGYAAKLIATLARLETLPVDVRGDRKLYGVEKAQARAGIMAEPLDSAAEWITLEVAQPASKAIGPNLGRQNPQVVENLLVTDLAAVLTVLFSRCADERARGVLLGKVASGVMLEVANQLKESQRRLRQSVPTRGGAVSAPVLRSELHRYAEAVDARLEKVLHHYDTEGPFPEKDLALDRFREELEKYAPHIYDSIKFMAWQTVWIEVGSFSASTSARRGPDGRKEESSSPRRPLRDRRTAALLTLVEEPSSQRRSLRSYKGHTGAAREPVVNRRIAMAALKVLDIARIRSIRDGSCYAMLQALVDEAHNTPRPSAKARSILRLQMSVTWARKWLRARSIRVMRAVVGFFESMRSQKVELFVAFDNCVTELNRLFGQQNATEQRWTAMGAMAARQPPPDLDDRVGRWICVYPRAKANVYFSQSFASLAAGTMSSTCPGLRITEDMFDAFEVDEHGNWLSVNFVFSPYETRHELLDLDGKMGLELTDISGSSPASSSTGVETETKLPRRASREAVLPRRASRRKQRSLDARREAARSRPRGDLFPHRFRRMPFTQNKTEKEYFEELTREFTVRELVRAAKFHGALAAIKGSEPLDKLRRMVPPQPEVWVKARNASQTHTPELWDMTATPPELKRTTFVPMASRGVV